MTKTTTKKTKVKSKRKEKSRWQKASEKRIKDRQKKKKENQEKFLTKVAKRKGFDHLKVVRWLIAEKNKKGFTNETSICCEPSAESLLKVLEKKKISNFAGLNGYFFQPYELGDMLVDVGDTEFGDSSRGKNEDEMFCDDCKSAILLTPEFVKKLTPKKKVAKSTKSTD